MWKSALTITYAVNNQLLRVLVMNEITGVLSVFALTVGMAGGS